MRVNLTRMVKVGDGEWANVTNRESFDQGGPEWILRYGNTDPFRHQIACLIESYNDLLSDEITTKEAISRLRKLRAAYISPAQQETRTDD